MFIGREKELQELERRYVDDHSQLVVLYGKRRLGKTALLKEFAKDKAHLFYVSRETIDSEQIKLFSEEILEGNPVKEFISSFDSWEKAFLFLLAESKKQRVLLIIDEFPYIAQSNREILSILQGVWDQHGSEGNMMFILTGSSLSYMEEDLLGPDSPLFGRTTSTIRLEALTFAEVRKLLKDFPLKDQIAYYGILGGVPRYLDAMDKGRSLAENIIEKCLNPYSFLHQEVTLLMREELREPSTYYAILTSVAAGNNTIKSIALSTGLDKTKINVYLKNLMQLGILYRKVPLLLPSEKVNQHRSMYLFKEPYFRFYFYFIIPNLTSLEKLEPKEFFEAKVQEKLPSFIEEEFQRIGIEILKEQNANGDLGKEYQQIGNTWSDKLLLPLFGYQDQQHILSGYCFYDRQPTMEELDEVKQFTTLYVKNPKTKVVYHFFMNEPIGEELKKLEAIDPSIHFVTI